MKESLGKFIWHSLPKGLKVAAYWTFLATWGIVFGIMLFWFVPGWNPLKSNYNIAFLPLVVAQGLIVLLLFSLVFAAFTFLSSTINVMILPAISASALLSLFLYQDARTNKLFLKTAEIKGAIVGAVFGIIGLFIPSISQIWPEIWLDALARKDLIVLLFIVLLPASAIISGIRLARILVDELQNQNLSTFETADNNDLSTQETSS